MFNSEISDFPLVSVVMITYGHENYIAQAIKSVLMQQYKGEIEFFIENDASPDNSNKIINEQIISTPKNIKIYYTKHEKNLGIMPNFVQALKKTNGKYIALCEGDDYWTDPLKLQKQIQILENNLTYSLVFHKTDELQINGKIIETNNTFKSRKVNKITTENLLEQNIIHTPSVVFRKEFFQIPEWYQCINVGDYPLWILLSLKGPIYYLPDSMAIYRNGVGVWSTSNRINKNRHWYKMMTHLEIYFQDHILKDKFQITYNKCILNYENSIIENKISLEFIVKSTKLKQIIKLPFMKVLYIFKRLKVTK